MLVGDATGGWHHRPGGVDPPNRRVIDVTDRIETGRLAGTYTAVVEICVDGRCRTKPTTFFPDHWTRSRVIETINQAYRRAHRRGSLTAGQRLRAVDDTGFPVQLIIGDAGEVTTAFPRTQTEP